MNKSFFLFLVVVVMTIGCTNGNTHGNVSGADSVYKWENIRQHLVQDPEYTLRLIDTAEMRGIQDVNEANYWRSVVYYNSEKIQDFDKAKEYCLKVLNNTKPAVDSVHYLMAVGHMVGILRMNQDTYQEAIRYAMEGAKRAHNAGDVATEANMYSDMGLMMEKMQYGSGIKYIERSLNLLREASRKDLRPLPILASYLGNTARRIAEHGDNARAVELLKEKLQVVDRIDKEYTTAPAGYCDEARATTYSVLAYCQWAMGDLSGAQKSADAFERLKDAVNPDFRMDIMNYYAFSGNGARVQEIYDYLEPMIREKQDTISYSYASLQQIYALGLNTSGRYREAYKTLDRYVTLNDSLLQRDRQQETLKYAQLMKTQEKELALKDKEVEGRIHRIIIISLAILLVVSILFIWRIVLAHKRLQEKNRQLFDTVQEMMNRENERQEALSHQPETTMNAAQQLYSRICQLMREKQPYTDSELNRDSLAQMLGTNYNAVAAAIREYADGKTIGDYLDYWRIRHAAALLRDTDNPIGLIIEQSGFSSRSHFSSLFRDKFKMTPSEYRKVAKEKAQ